MTSEQPVDKFGKFIIDHLRDRSIHTADLYLSGKLLGPGDKELCERLKGLSDEQRILFRDTILAVVDNSIFVFLRSLQESHDFNDGIQVLVDGKDVALESNMLHGEIFDWETKYSKYPSSDRFV